MQYQQDHPSMQPENLASIAPAQFPPRSRPRPSMGMGTRNEAMRPVEQYVPVDNGVFAPYL